MFSLTIWQINHKPYKKFSDLSYIKTSFSNYV